MIPEDFYGKKQFIWWVGVVEDVNDPMKMGSVRVRIIGIHSDDKTKVPTEQLPWAQVVLPTTGAKTTSGPREGDWVKGFFQDGEYAQIPIVEHVFPGIESKQSQIVYQEAVVRGGSNSHPVSTQTDRTVGEPTTPNISRGVIDGTLVNRTNNQLAHVCDFVSEMQKNMKLREYMRTAAQAIRDGIRKILLALGFGDATGKATWAINLLKAIKRELDWFNKTILKPIQDFEKYVLAYIVKMRAIVQWILSLPARFIAMLQDCLSRITNLIGAIFTDTIGGFQEGMNLNSGGEFTELINAAKDVANSAKETLNTTMSVATMAIAIPVSATAGLLQPVSQSELAAANTYIASYESSNDNKVTSPNEGKQQP